jgi:hypothetical protein
MLHYVTLIQNVIQPLHTDEAIRTRSVIPVLTTLVGSWYRFAFGLQQ